MKRSLVIAMGVAMATSAFAQTAITSVTPAGLFGSFYGTDTETDPGVVGFKFTMNQDVFVTDLGVWDDDGDQTLASSHQVGIWEVSSTNLLVDATVDGNSTFDSEFLYESVSSTMLTAGTEYIIGATYWSGNGDSYTSNGTYGLSGDINIINGVFPDAGGLGFIMPGSDSAGNSGRVGPNFKYEPVPEPATMAVLGLGALAALRRKKKA